MEQSTITSIPLGKKATIPIIGLVICVSLFFFATTQVTWAYTFYANKQTTGYAMGNLGYGSHTFIRGDVATHNRGHCGDPAGYWARGTRLDMASGMQIAIPGYWGFNPYDDIFATFYKWDVGDYNCVKNPYWLDIYFYRFTRYGETCGCPGVSTPPNSCVAGANTNSCHNATAYGPPLKSYYGP